MKEGWRHWELILQFVLEGAEDSAINIQPGLGLSLPLGLPRGQQTAARCLNLGNPAPARALQQRRKHRTLQQCSGRASMWIDALVIICCFQTRVGFLILRCCKISRNVLIKVAKIINLQYLWSSKSWVALLVLVAGPDGDRNHEADWSDYCCYAAWDGCRLGEVCGQLLQCIAVCWPH